jgi:hypothetical protein
MLALPYAYSKVDVHGRAALLYGRAVEAFGEELDKVDASIRSIRQGEFLEALAREEIRRDQDWVIHLRRLPEAPETFYLMALMASHDFQTALQNYLDLEDLRLDSRMRLRLEQREHVARRLERLLIAPRPEHLATADEQRFASRIARLEALAVDGSHPREAALQRRLQRLSGVLTWRLETQYHQRLTEAHTHLRELDEDLDVLKRRYETFVRARQAATHGYAGYEIPIKTLRTRVGEALERVDVLMARQGHLLETVAIQELELRRARLTNYQHQARFAFADSYDRAAKAQAQ